MLAALLSCEEPPVPNEQEAEFAADLFWILCRSKKSVISSSNQIVDAWL
jgi:hypothetical protein